MSFTPPSKHGGLSLDEVARRIGVTKEGVAHIERRAIAKLRVALLSWLRQAHPEQARRYET